MKNIYAILIIVNSWLYGDFGPSISYAVQVKNSNLWGIGNSQSINNNQGKAGIIIGISSSLSVCPCLGYGVTPWLGGGVAVPYNYTDEDSKNATKKQTIANQSYQVACTVSPSNSGQRIDVTQIFEQADAFVANLDGIIDTVTNFFPDITKGQGYESAAFLNFCTTPISLIERINTCNKQVLGWASFENYFPNSIFRLSLDLRQMVPSADDIKSGNVFASAIINHYLTLVQTLRVTSGKTSITSDMLIQKEQAIKDALLW
jgi:hypothetical protein